MSKSLNFYLKHREHIDQLIKVAVRPIVPSSEDINEPMLYKPEHWKWRLNWRQVPWEGNHAITIPAFKNANRVLHVAYKCINTTANNGYGEWTEGDGFEYTIKGSHSGRCPANIKTLEEAMAYLDKTPNA